MSKRNLLTLKNMQVLEFGEFKNFSGRKHRFNDAGKRYFTIKFDYDDPNVEALKEEGWKIKTHIPNDDKYEPYHFLQVKVNYDVDYEDLIPDIYMEEEGYRPVKLNPNTVCELDKKDIISVDVRIRPRRNPDRPGEITAYCDTLYALVETDELARDHGMLGSADDEDDMM